MSSRWDLIRVSLARRFFLATIVQAAVIICLAVILAHVFGAQAPAPRLRLPPSFAFSTVFLLLGSCFLEQAHSHVRREHQQSFRRSLLIALAFAWLFVAVQGYGIWAIDKGIRSEQAAQLGIHGFAIMLAGLHGMHFLVAQSVLLWVTLSAFADRYDHEYFWGVTFAAWCWHVLGIVWLGILFVFTMALAV